MICRTTFSRLTTFALVVAALLVSASASRAAATNVYIAQSATGTADGSSCTAAQPVSFFNNASNWGGGSTQIGPGTTVHICGTITAGTNTSGLFVQGSGSSGQPITILFEPGAIVQSPRFGGAPDGSCSTCDAGIAVNNFNYITIDGNNTGIVQNTANGSSLANHSNSIGVYLWGDHLLLKNLTVQNIYNNSSAEPDSQPGFPTADVRVSGLATNVEVCNNTLNNAHVGIWSASEGPSFVVGPTGCTNSEAAAGINYYNNFLSDHGWMMNIGGHDYVNIYQNEMTDWANWFFPTGTPYHLDGLLIASGAGNIIHAYVYSNYIHGDFVNGSPTGFIFCTYGVSGSGSSCTIFNNLLVGTGHTSTGGQGIYFHSSDGNPLGPHFIYNNTLFGFGTGEIYMDGDSTQTYTVKNNIFVSNHGSYISINSTPRANFNSDNNVFFGGRNLGGNTGGFPGGENLAAWQGQGEDAHSVEADPNLSSTWHIQSSSSPAVQKGANLTSLNLNPLDAGKPSVVGLKALSDGIVRPSGAAWDVGAYPFTGTTVSAPPAPPTGLTVKVN